MPRQDINYISPTYADIDEYINHMVTRIRDSAPMWVPDRVVAIARGGLIPSAMIAHKLSVDDVSSIDIRMSREYVDKLYDLFVTGIHRRTLIIDDIIDGGDTMNRLNHDANEIRDFYKVNECNVRTAGLVVNTNSTYDLHSFEGYQFDKQPNDWIVFPWETMRSTERKQLA